MEKQNKKVKIVYTIDLESVPDEVCKLIFDIRTNNLDKIKLALSDVEYFLNEKDAIDSISKIKNLREELLNIDLRLGDVESILEGYQKVKNE